MAIYLIFLQHIIFSLKPEERLQLWSQQVLLLHRVELKKRLDKNLIDDKMLRGVISMPPNIFATTGTSVSILFIDKTNKKNLY